MKIEQNKVVRFHFKISDQTTGEKLSESDEASLYLHGHNNIFSAVEEQLEGKQAGDQVTTVLSPGQAYGEIENEKPVRVPRKHIATKGKLSPGQIVVVNTTEGMQEARVMKVGLKTVDLEGDHPYAGKTLEFDIRIEDVRDATEDEISHGHAHGDGGHHH